MIIKKQYSSLYIQIPEPIRKDLLNYTNKIIDPKFIVGIEDDPHITVKYGITTNDVLDVARAIRPLYPIDVEIGKISMFAADEFRDSDVLKLDIICGYLNQLNKRVEQKLKTVSTYKGYFPHCTLAYLQSGTAMLYLDKNEFLGTKFTVNELVFSPLVGDKSIIDEYGRIVNYK